MTGLKTVQGYGSKVDTMVEELILCLEAPWSADEILTYCCRPLSISMGNAIRFLKARIAKLAVSLPEAEAKASLVAEIDKFMQEKIVFADKEIVKHAVTKIRDGDVLLTHGWSCVVEMILIRAKEMGKKFRVVVVDSRPKLEGKGLLRQLLSKNIQCTYTHMNASPYIMQEVTRVFLGASSVLSNGTVYSRVGTACVAMVAHAFSVPVMICCETYKFHERVQLDSITSNELGKASISFFKLILQAGVLG
jgi:translation initiation factor eIF-2B subunit delta